MENAIRASLVGAYDAALVDELLAAYEEAKQNYYLGGLRLRAYCGRRSQSAARQVIRPQARWSMAR